MKSKSLKLIYQLDPQGCGYACIAMITGKKYFQIREFASEIIPSLSAEKIGMYISSPGLLTNQVKSVLEYLKIKCRWIKFESLNKLKHNAILFICSITDGDSIGGHAIVFDKTNKKLLDPGFGNKISLNNYNIYSCLEILE